MTNAKIKGLANLLVCLISSFVCKGDSPILIFIMVLIEMSYWEEIVFLIDNYKNI